MMIKIIQIVAVFLVILLNGCSTYKMAGNVLLISPNGHYYKGELSGETQSPSTSSGKIYFPDTPFGELDGKISAVQEGPSIAGKAISFSGSGLNPSVGKINAGNTSKIGKLYLKKPNEVCLDCSILVEVVALSNLGMTYSIEGFGECFDYDNVKYDIKFEPPD